MINPSIAPERWHWQMLANRIAAAFLLSCLIGCSSQSTAEIGAESAPEMPLTVQQPDVDLGVVRMGSKTEHQYLIRVWDKGPVKVTDAGTSCCGRWGLTPELTGRTLEAGAEIPVTLRLRSDTPGESAVEARIRCDAAEEPLRLILTGTFVGTPTVIPNPVLIDAIGNGSSEVAVKGTLLRTAVSTPLTLDTTRSDSGALQIIPGLLSSRPYALYSGQTNPVIYDELPLTILVPQADAGLSDERMTLKLAWNDEEQITEVPVTIRRLPAIMPVVSRLFCGILKPDQGWSGELKFRRLGSANQVTVSHVKSTSEFVEVTPSDDGLACRVHVKGDGQNHGRQSATLVIGYSDSRLPAVEIPVSWVVVDD